MAAISDYLEAKLLDLVFNKVAYTAPSTYVALFTGDPTDAGTGPEVSGGSYARVLVNENGGSSPTWDLAVIDGAGKLVDNTHQILFPTATADWTTITHKGIYDASSGGNLLWHGPLITPKPIGDGDTFKFEPGELNLKLE